MSDETPPEPEPVKKKAAPGWYKHPSQEGMRRYWDGAAWTDQVKPADEPSKAQDTRASWIIGGLVMAAFLFILVVSSLGGDDDGGGGSDDDGGGEYGARDVCEQFVEDRLKSPSTAEFSETTASEVAGAWTVRGAVDSQNGFGAMVRNNYVCKVRHTGGDNWTLVDLNTSQR